MFGALFGYDIVDGRVVGRYVLSVEKSRRFHIREIVGGLMGHG